MSKRRSLAILLALYASSGVAAADTLADPATDAKKIAAHQIFAKWNNSTPGCAAGVAVNGQPVNLAGYGMADLEREVRNSANTIFEAGSVSKQFTAAAVLLLALDGKLSLDDSVRKYVPEVPAAYGDTITIRQMLQHTSGLRDWGVVADVAGWPRGTRQYTHAHVLDIVSRQSELNFAPGTRWSYSNTGYNLAAIIVERVSGVSLQEFTRTRIFEPLGMTSTSWRDDHTRVVKRRALAYGETPEGFRLQMPFENVYGNGGLLTTVGDLLEWDENFSSGKVGGEKFVSEMQRTGHFQDGKPHNYALGLFVSEYKGVPEVSHSGSTGGYRAFLTRYPAQHVSVAVLCNVTTRAEEYAHKLADLYMPPGTLESPRAAKALTPARLDRLTGLYASPEAGAWLDVVRDDKGFRVANGSPLKPLAGSKFHLGERATLELRADGSARLEDGWSGGWNTFQRVQRAEPGADELSKLVGTYFSPDAETTMAVALEGSKLMLKRRVDSFELEPLYGDSFRFSDGLVTFRRDASGKPTAFTISSDRVWSLNFQRTE